MAATPATAVRIGGRHFRIGSSERDRSAAKSSLQSRGGVKCRRRHDVSRATVNKDRRENYRVGRGGEGSEGEGDLVEVRARTSRACTYIREAFAARNGDEGVARSARGREGSTCQGETCHSLTPCHLHKQMYITGRQAASYVFPFMFPHARSHKPVSLVSRAAQSFTVAGSAPALTTVRCRRLRARPPCPPTSPYPDK